MNAYVYSVAKELQTHIDALDPQLDQSALLWVHGFLTGLKDRVEEKLPELKTAPELLSGVHCIGCGCYLKGGLTEHKPGCAMDFRNWGN